MSDLFILKFGGSSLAGPEGVDLAVSIVKSTLESGSRVCVVVSAQGDTTDRLISNASRFVKISGSRELDALLSCGESMSSAIFAMKLSQSGVPAQSLNALQAGIITDEQFGKACIRTIDTSRLEMLLSRKTVPVVTGFQGITLRGDITTLGRGGSDTTAVALSHWLEAKESRLYSDVRGVFTADPGIVPDARLIPEISYDEMMELSLAGAGVVNSKALETASRFSVPVRALCTFGQGHGTLIREGAGMDSHGIRSITYTKNESRISLFGISQKHNSCPLIISALESAGIRPSLFMHSINGNGTENLFLVIQDRSCERAETEIRKFSRDFERLVTDRDTGTLSLVGSDITSVQGIFPDILSLLTSAKIPIYMVSETQIRIAIVINASDIEKAVLTLHEGLGLSSG